MSTTSRIGLTLVILCTCLLLSTGPTQSQAPPAAPIHYVAMPAQLSGGNYRWQGSVWYVQGIAAGGDFRLESVAAPRLTGNGCCCVHLSCILKK